MDRFAGTPERSPKIAMSASSPVIIAKAYTTNLVAVIQDASQENFAPVILWPHSSPRLRSSRGRCMISAAAVLRSRPERIPKGAWM